MQTEQYYLCWTDYHDNKMCIPINEVWRICLGVSENERISIVLKNGNAHDNVDDIEVKCF